MVAKVEYSTCDRCGEKIDYHTKSGANVKYAKVVHICWRMFQYLSEKSTELCNDCAEGLHEYLYDKKPLKER